MQNWNLSRTVLRLIAVGVLAGALTLFGCSGGEEEEQPKVAASNAVLNINSTVVRALESQPFTFSSGEALDPGLANEPVTLTFTNTAAATPNFTLTSPTLVGTDGNPARATGTTQFGSCLFTVTQSTFPPFKFTPRVGVTVRIDPCTVEVTTQGLVADGLPNAREILMQLGIPTSNSSIVTVAINPDGTFVLNNITTGQSVTLRVATGSSGTTT